MGSPLLIYTPESSPRLDYITDFIFGEILGLLPETTTSVDTYLRFKGPKINYSAKDIDTSLKVLPSGLMFENEIRRMDITAGSWMNIPAFFMTDPEAGINFDLFSASFYMLSRYEEYLPYVPDSHGRFRGSISFASKHGFLEQPVVDLWAIELGVLLEKRYTGCSVKKRTFQWKSTIDVDTAWAYLNRNIFRTSLSLAASIFRGPTFLKRIRVLARSEQDPFDTFGFLRDYHAAETGNVLFFFLSGKPGGKDRNTDPHHREWQKLVKEVSSVFETGIHPSVRSHEIPGILGTERNLLSSLIGKPVLKSRQHYLLLDFPGTCRQMMDAGITGDYSMGFADRCGFRAGTSHPFRFYDLEKESITGLRIWPFAVMDRTLQTYMGLNTGEALVKICELIDTVYHAGGNFISLFHNDTLGNDGEWKGWKEVYMEMIGYLRKRMK